MEFEQMIRIIETVSNSSLTAFHYEANGVKIDMEREAGAAPAGVSPVAAGNVTAGAAAALPAAGTAAAAETTVPAGVSAPAGTPAAVSAAAVASPAGAAVAASAAADTVPAATAVAEEALKEGNMVTSPLVGTFYAAPAEDAEPFVKVGDHVKKGQTLGIVEAMKLMNEIESDYDGVVTAILVQNGDTVEYGMPLFCIA